MSTEVHVHANHDALNEAQQRIQRLENLLRDARSALEPFGCSKDFLDRIDAELENTK